MALVLELLRTLNLALHHQATPVFSCVHHLLLCMGLPEDRPWTPWSRAEPGIDEHHCLLEDNIPVALSPRTG